MRDYTEINLNYIGHRAHFVHFGNETGGERVEIADTRIPDCPTLLVRLPNRDLYLHSKFDPVLDGRRWVDRQDVKPDSAFLFVFGMGLGYHVEALIGKYQNVRKVIVFEVSPDVFKASLAARDLSAIFNSDKVIVIAGNYMQIQESIRKFMLYFSEMIGDSEKTEVLIHKPSLEVFPEESEDLRNTLEYIRIASNSRSTFDKERAENEAANSEAFAAAPGVKELFGSYEGRDLIVAAAGPSLDQSLELLKAAPVAPDIVTVDSALAPFHRAGLRPKFVVSGDPQKKTDSLFTGLNIESENLIFFKSSNPDVVGRFPAAGRWAAYSSVRPDEVNKDKGDLFFSGTVFLAALDFAVKTGAKPIVLIGADFSFLESQTHASGSRIQGYTPRYGRLREVAALDGSMVKTSDILYVYLKDTEKYNLNLNEPGRIFNATARGAAIFHMPHFRFERYLEEYCKMHGFDSGVS